MASLIETARAMALEGHFEYAIDLYLDGLRKDPDDVVAHRELREVGLKRKAAGGSDLGMLAKVKLRKPAGDAVEDLLNTEKLLAYDPSNINWVAAAVNHANTSDVSTPSHAAANAHTQAFFYLLR